MPTFESISESITRGRIGERRIVFDARHSGFDGIVNGGYVAGLLQNEIRRAAEVRLARPVPPQRELRLVRPDRVSVALIHDGELLAGAVAKPAHYAPPSPVAFDRALEAQPSYLAFVKTPAPDCFVCGPRRHVGLGLRIFSGALTPGRVAAAWVPEASTVGGTEVDARFVGAALDCPGAWAIASLGDSEHVPMLLGTLHLQIVAPVRSGLSYVVVGQADGGEGRKRFARTALYEDDGRLCASAQSVWLRMK